MSPRQSHEDGARSGCQPPRVRLMGAVPTTYGDLFVHREICLLASHFSDAAPVAITIGPQFAVAEFRFRAASPRRATDGGRGPASTTEAGTEAMFIATAVDGDKEKVLMSTHGWPDPMPEVPGPEDAFYRWASEDTDSWEVL